MWKRNLRFIESSKLDFIYHLCAPWLAKNRHFGPSNIPQGALPPSKPTLRFTDDENITGFVLDKSNSNGITLGDEEKKLGLHSSSTRQVFYDKTAIPIEQMLGERNGGFKIAMNALNTICLKSTIQHIKTPLCNCRIQQIAH